MATPGTERGRFDAVIVGGGHNGLVAAALLAQADRSVLVLERRERVGGAAVSADPFGNVGARLSRYSYLVSLFPERLLRMLRCDVEMRPRRIASYTPLADDGVLVDHGDERRTEASMNRVAGNPREFDAWQRFHVLTEKVAGYVFPTLTQPLRSREEMGRLIDDEIAWKALFEEPLSVVLQDTFASDLVRGLVLTDAVVGTFAPADDRLLRQNRCFLYHVIGNGTGRWDVPVGGMGALTAALYEAAVAAGAEIRTGAEVTEIETDDVHAQVRCADGAMFECRHLLSNAAPAVLAHLLGETPPAAAPEGSQLKVNMVLRRLPRLRDPSVTPPDAFTGTFHINEGYDQMARAYAEANEGNVPSVPPCEVYCHSLTDPSILSSELQSAGAQTLTLFGLHMPARLFGDSAARERAVAATLDSLNSVLAEPIEDCLWRTDEGQPCLEVLTPPELEAELAMPAGHIFHRDLAWPFAESDEEIGRWGVETEHRNIWLCGAGARRGGGVSGIPGHNAARAVLEAETR